jgi:diguanylate cyclase (GGDEF)-like protein/PAS domain S-box-containing protein
VAHPNQEWNDLGDGAPRGADKPEHANGTPGEDDRWLRSVLENSSEIIKVVDPNGTLRYASPAFGRILGHDLDEAVGTMNVFDHVHPEDLTRVLEEIEKALSAEGVGRTVVEYRFRHKDGSWRWMEGVGTYLPADPAVRGILVETLPAVTYTDRAVGSYPDIAVHTSPQIESLVGYSVEEWLDPERDLWEERLHPEDRNWVLAADERSKATGEPFAEEYRLIARDGSVVWVRDEAALMRNEAGEPLYWQGVLLAVTDRKQAEEALRESERRFRAITQHSSDIVTLLGATGTIRYQSPSVERILGYGQAEMIGNGAFDYVHPDDLERVEMAFAEGLVDYTRRPSVEYRFRHKDGSWVWLESLGTNRLGDPGVGEYVVTSRNITVRKQAETRLREAEERFRRSFADAAIGMALVGTDGRWLRVNRSLCEIVGYPEEELVGKTFQDITHPDDLEIGLVELRRLLAGEIRTNRIEKRYLRKDGQVVWVLLTISLVRDEGDEPLYFVTQVQDVTGRKRMEERLRRQALHDALTGLPNRQLFVDRLGQALRRTRRQGNLVAVLFMDLDEFKVVNDSLGHEAGDLLLTVVAQRLQRYLRPEDTLARFGGDEFVVLIDDVHDPAEAVQVAERITEELRRPFILTGRELYVAVSIGISIGHARTHDPDSLLREADTAMYRVKGEGGGYTVFDPSMYERALGRLEVELDLRRAIEREELVVHYQPIVNLQTGKLWGVEALVRWDHPERGLLNPGEFVPVAEESGLVVPMGELVLDEACHRAAEWQREFPRTPPLAMSVNLSGRQLRHPNLHEVIGQALNESGLPASSLGLDITETVYIGALDANTAALDRLKALGIRISLDDFGSGYSSLSYLKRLPADILKIDKSFTKGFGVEVEDTAIVQTVVDLAHILGMEVVAEGVEIEEQETLLKEMGCDFAQGYFFSRPLPPETVPTFLSR